MESVASPFMPDHSSVDFMMCPRHVISLQKISQKKTLFWLKVFVQGLKTVTEIVADQSILPCYANR